MLLWSDIEQEYGIQILKQVKVRDVYQLNTQNHGILCLKSYDVPEPEVRFILQVFTYLSGNDFTYSPKVLTTLSQAPFITRNDIRYVLTDWIIGQTPEFSRRPDFKKAMRFLAGFHSIAQGLPDQPIPEARIKYNRLGDKIAAYQQMLDGYPSLISICGQALEHLNAPASQAAVLQEQAANAFVHGDFNYPNLILDHSRRIHMIDFENTSLNVRMQDLSHILHRNLSWQGKDMLAWIEYYDRKRPLGKEDFHLLYALLHVPYPAIRALKLNKRNRRVKIDVPSISRIDNYMNELKQLL